MEWEVIIVKFEVRLFHEPSLKHANFGNFIFKLNRTTAFEEVAENDIFLNYQTRYIYTCAVLHFSYFLQGKRLFNSDLKETTHKWDLMLLV